MISFNHPFGKKRTWVADRAAWQTAT